MIFGVKIVFESNGDRNKAPPVEKNINKNKPYLKDSINNLKKSGTWRILLIKAINFIFPKHNDKDYVINSKSHNKENMTNEKAGEVI